MNSPSLPRAFRRVAVLIVAIALVSCASAPVVIPPELSASTLVQRAQEAADASRWDEAVSYYSELVARYPDPGNLAAAGYELAFIDYKRGKVADAKKGFENLIALYDQAPEGTYPPRYRVLAEKVLAKLK